MKNWVSFCLFITTNAFALDCTVQADHLFDDLNHATVSDTDIVTEDDLLFCPDQNLKNANVDPENLPDDGSIWRAGNRRWNDDWEKKYQDWVKNSITSDVFEKLDFPTDCADAALSIRAIFSRIHHLPASFGGTQFLHSAKEFSKHETVVHWSEETWMEDFKKDKRFRTALHSWNQKIGTVNLDRDTYQIEMTDKATGGPSSCVAPGTVYLSDGHAEFITFNNESIFPYRLSSSTVPSKVRPLAENIIYQPSLYDHGSEKANKTRGYLWWNWTVNCKGKFTKVPDEKMPYYSNEQELIMNGQKQSLTFDINRMFQESLGLSRSELDQEIEKEIYKLVVDVDNSILSRHEIVAEGLQVCSSYGVNSARDCFNTKGQYGYTLLPNGIAFHPDDIAEKCEGENCPPELPKEERAENIVEVIDLESLFSPKSATLKQMYYNFSTPSRDKRLLERLQSVREHINNLSDYEARVKLNEFLMDKKVDIGNGKTISYYHLSQMYYISPQPWDAEDLRWGSAEMPKIKNNFYHYQKETIKKYDELKQSSDVENLRIFEEKNKLFIKEKKLIDEYFE